MFQFVTPTGPYAIGTLTYHWTDDSRADFGDPAMPRELMVQIWYPAEPTAGAAFDTYIQDGVSFGEFTPGMPLPGVFLSHLNEVRTHAMRSAPMAAGGDRFPVLVFSPGAQGFRQHDTFAVEALVSHGYVVAAIDHPRAAREVLFPDGRRVPFDPKLIDVPRFLVDPDYANPVFNYLGADVSFALDEINALDAGDATLAGRLDLERIGMFGVSLGGLVAAEACRTDPRIKACVILDVFVPTDVVEAGVSQPTMWLSRDADSMRAEGWSEHDVDLHQSSMRAAFEGSRSDAYFVQIPGMFHLNYTDFPYTVATTVGRRIRLMGPIDWHRGHDIINAYMQAFFDRHLKAEAEPLLDGPSADYAEVRLEAGHP